MGEMVTLEVDGGTGVATIRLQRPPMNAISLGLCAELEEAVTEAAERDDIGAVVVWGGPKVFAAGADIKEFPDFDAQKVTRVAGPILQRTMAALAGLPKPTIAAINGYALGGGCELALACDFRFAADNAKLGQPEILLGLIPGAGGSQRLPRLVGVSRAKELIFSGRMVDMIEAPQIGLVDAVYPADEVYEQACEQAAAYAAGPYALRLAKQAIDQGLDGTLADGLKLETTLFAACFATEDTATGVRSFLDNGPGKATFARR